MPQVIGVYNYVDPEDRDAIFREIRRVKAGESNGFTLDLRVTPKGEPTGWTRVNVVRNPLNTDPSKIEMVCVNFDVTELKQTEKNLIEAKNKAEVSDRLKSAFLANMSHEIRTPLNAIVGFSNLLAETDDIGERREYMRVVEENNELLLKLISDILDLSKIEAGTFEFNYGRVDVNRMCEETVRSLSLKVKDKPVELIFGEHDAQCCVVGDKNRLIQVITNFINNAVKFTDEGSITLGYRTEGGELLFHVEDTGSGISEEHRQSIFDRFVKLNSFAQGTGLGLSISKSIVEQMGGRIGVESEVGRGSRFWFTIPVVTCDAPEKKGAAPAPRPAAVHGDGRLPRLLVAEDTDSNYLLVSLMLRKEFDIVRASDGEEAVKICRELKPAAILMDVKMPGMDGLEAHATDPHLRSVGADRRRHGVRLRPRPAKGARRPGPANICLNPLTANGCGRRSASCFRKNRTAPETVALRYAVRRDSGCHGCRCGSHTLLMQVRPAGNGKRPLPDRLISASRSFPQTETCLRPVQPPFPAATCRGARRRSCSCAQFFLPGRTSA